MATVDQMRTTLADVYPGPKWRLKCMTMPERQVIAIYKNLSEKDKLKKKPKKKKDTSMFEPVQLTMFDIDYSPNG